MAIAQEKQLYRGPHIGVVNAHVLDIVTSFGNKGIHKVESLMTRPGIYNPRNLSSRYPVRSNSELQEVLTAVVTAVSHSFTEVRGKRVTDAIGTLPQPLLLKWYDFNRAVTAVISTHQLKARGYLDGTTLVEQPDLLEELLKQRFRDRIHIGRGTINLVGSPEPITYRLPQALSVDLSKEKARVIGAYNFSPIPSDRVIKDAAREKGAFDNPQTRRAISKAIRAALGLVGNHVLTIPSGDELEFSLVVTGVADKNGLYQAAFKLGYDDAMTLGINIDPSRVSWFVLNIMTGRLRREADWRSYFNVFDSSKIETERPAALTS